MSMKDGDLKVISAIVTVGVCGGLVLLLMLPNKAEAHKPILQDFDVIEASIAFTKAPQKQPQKKFKQPDPVKPEGVSHDENKKPVETKPEQQKKKPDNKQPSIDDLKKFHHDDDDDQPPGKPTTDPGDFNGNEYGWATTTKGHPYWQKLVQDFRQGWEIPTILNVKGNPVGCFHITADGKIADTQFKEKSGDDALDDSVQRALDALKKLRNANPVPVPTELLGATNRWICFRFNPNPG
jgi:outer membrane biosynthesis protein TonB